MITHLVFFKLNDPTPENLNTFREKLLSLKTHIPQINHLEAGINIIPSDRSYDVALFTRFDSRDALTTYQANPYHLQVLEYIRSVVSSVVSVDYES